MTSATRAAPISEAISQPNRLTSSSSARASISRTDPDGGTGLPHRRSAMPEGLFDGVTARQALGDASRNQESKCSVPSTAIPKATEAVTIDPTSTC